ncbi:uncharacterized protein LOC117318508 [Pecten maximus]|uniref:uncharacterized protein LOC117318508 n=1 Tax=Pecten maximus TaxID=6579 RepID=UPI001458AD3C|nr:uncharacterized protein LOC117318508 [Pecten maximus]
MAKQESATGGAVRYKLRDRPKVKSSIPYRDFFTSICPTSDGNAWLCCWDTYIVKLINKKGEVIQTIHHESPVEDISLDPTTGRLWFCCRAERTICELSSSFSPVTRFTTEGWARSLCVTREGRVLVGTQGKPIGRECKQEGYEIAMYSTDGRVLRTTIVEKSKAGYVRSILECDVTGNIAVVSISDSRHVIVYSPTLQPLFHYRGEGIQVQKSVTPGDFSPWTLVYDSKGNIVIADNGRRTIELISGAGKYIKTLHTNKDFQGPVGMQEGDVLWSGLEVKTSTREIKLFKYYSK